ncbi:hypothetical protein CRE_13704 [Caenorhabditis remanei]|uniref:F-box domain-containing protein n=1 Tax=Caenorhabditis remanei TaxID=31234 RepID=E3NBS4_CAERE|nr:hypothetical protein CRE_13704 [Caenorhabditis remanei]
MSETPSISIYESLFAQSDETDAILVVEGKKMHVNKTVLSFHSDYFKTLFNGEFKEKSMPEIPIEDVNFEDFAATLSLLFPSPIKPTDENVERLLEIADRFLIPSAKDSLKLFMKLCKMEKMNKIRIQRPKRLHTHIPVRIADKNKFMDSPIDLAAFVLYNLRMWESAERTHYSGEIPDKTSYEKYEKLCKAMGKEAISYEEYKYWFHMYYKQRERDDLPIPDIRGCILSDVINGKTAEKSMNDLSEAFKNHKIDKEDHGYWYKRFENGHLFSQVTFSNLPENVVSEIAEKCDLMSYLQLRKVSNGLRSILDHSKPPLTHFSFEFEENQISLNLNNEVPVIFTDLNDLDPPSHFPGHFYKFKDNDYAKVAFNYLEMVLKNRKLQLNHFGVVFPKEKHNKSNQMLRDLLSSLSHKIHAKHFVIRFQNDEDLITMLKCIKPGTLKSLSLGAYIEDDGELPELPSIASIDILVEMEQWKQAKYLRILLFLDTSIEHFFHFKAFDIYIISLSIEDALNLAHALSNNSDFNSCRIEVERYDQEAVKNALRIDQDNLTELFPNLYIQFDISEIVIRNVDSPLMFHFH